MIHISTNVIYTTNKMQSMVPEYGKVRYYYKAIDNYIFLLTNMANKYRVTFDSRQDEAFTIHANKRIVKFRI